MSSGWQLPTEILKRSVAKTFAEAVNEWNLTSVEFLAPGESTVCLCTHKPIRQLCHIFNPSTQERVIVGNECIKRFGKADSGCSEAAFGNISKIMSAAKKILADPEASANEELITFALAKKTIRPKDASFYNEIWRKKELTQRQMSYKVSINLTILFKHIFSEKQAYFALTENPKGTAGPKLIDRAFKDRVLSEPEKDFYTKVWAKKNKWLTPKQQQYRFNLNSKIITQMKSTLSSSAREEGKESPSKKMKVEF